MRVWRQGASGLDRHQATIEGALKNGDMTREEADAKYKKIRERLAQRVKEKDAKN
jgi:hypothetical protein